MTSGVASSRNAPLNVPYVVCTKPAFFAARGAMPVAVRRHPHHVREQVVADRREKPLVPDQVARGLRHRDDLALREQVLLERRALEAVVAEVPREVAVHDERRLRIARLAERQLHVR